MEFYGDFDTSVRRALKEIDPKWESYDGLIICGTHYPKDTDAMIDKIRIARENGTPFLGICHGHQLSAVEYARNVRKIKTATSQEFGRLGRHGNPTYVVKKRDKLKVGLHDGETYWSDYEVVIPLSHPDHFFTAPFHPEYNSSKDKPHPFLVKFLDYAKKAMAV